MTEDQQAEAAPMCRRCGLEVVQARDLYDVFEQMHWICFHLEHEHEGDPDEPCRAAGCPWLLIAAYEKKLSEMGLDPSSVAISYLLPDLEAGEQASPGR